MGLFPFFLQDNNLLRLGLTNYCRQYKDVGAGSKPILYTRFFKPEDPEII